MIQIKRAYEPTSPEDGYRVLIDRLWPRGLGKDELPLDAWARDISPTTELRKWFGHDPERWREFARRYRDELRTPEAKERLEDLAAHAARGTVTIVYGARDQEHNNAVVLRAELERRLRARPGGRRAGGRGGRRARARTA